jgi:hypothetical protein
MRLSKLTMTATATATVAMLIGVVVAAHAQDRRIERYPL